jgi:hypothetical protein
MGVVVCPNLVRTGDTLVRLVGFVD